MVQKHNLLALIPARSGSKGIQGKNMVLLHGKPLISYTIQTALACPYIEEVYVSSDSDKIRAIAAQYGAKNLGPRPKYLAKDDTEMIQVLDYELRKFENMNDKKVDFVVLLQPTSPLRIEEDIRNCIDVYLHERPDAVITIHQGHANPYKNMLIKKNKYYRLALPKKNGYTNRQKLPSTYQENGAVYVFSRRSITLLRTLHPQRTLIYKMPPERSIDIDTPFDLDIAEYLFIKHSIPVPNA